ncbi:MAG TPA: hypothetical protein VLI05_04695 [Candidatus Saccharimonadia bacterium]|nr:hypothetical protein [Candidatus Saccharimonadia bacterium]
MVAINDQAIWGVGPNAQPLLVPAALRGYRAMKVRRLRDQPATWALHGIRTPWRSGTMRAVCLATDDPCGDAPNYNCSCGIYHSYTPNLGNDRPDLNLLIVTASRGRVLLGTRGFRSQQARLLAAAPRPVYPAWRASEPLWQRQCQVMDCLGIRVFPTLQALVEAFPPEDMSSLL